LRSARVKAYFSISTVGTCSQSSHWNVLISGRGPDFGVVRTKQPAIRTISIAALAVRTRATQTDK
jgi:hypothetical protein